MLNKYIFSIFLLLFSTSTIGQDAPPVESFGWAPPKAEEVKQLSDSCKIYNSQLQELVKLNDDTDAFNYRYLYKALAQTNQLSDDEKSSKQLSSLNQKDVGSCVGYSTTQALNVVTAVNAVFKKELRQIWIARANPDAIYAIGRQKSLGSWDGNSGAASIDGLKNIGTLHRIEYPGFDLRNTKPTDGRKWAARPGLPEGLIKLAGDHKLVSAAHIKTIDEAKAALQNGYAIIVCAQASYGNKRDADGFSKLTGRAWSHAMCVCAYRSAKTSKREGFLIINSWGDDWNSGPFYPEDQPKGSFWVTPQDLKVHLDQEDSWALADYDGFKFRRITWEEVFKVGEPIR